MTTPLDPITEDRLAKIEAQLQTILEAIEAIYGATCGLQRGDDKHQVEQLRESIEAAKGRR